MTIEAPEGFGAGLAGLLRDRRSPAWQRLSLALALLMVAIEIAAFLVQGWQAITFPYQLDYGEGPILQLARELAAGRSLYPPVDQPPYLIASYEPAYQLLCALGVRLFGVQFWFGRLVSFLCVLGIAFAAGAIVRQRTGDGLAAFLAGGGILAMPHFLVWSTYMRVDAFALAMACGGFWLFGRGRRLAGGTLFALGVFTRRTTVAALAAAWLGRLRSAGLRRAFAGLVAQTLAVILLLVAANALTAGGMYRQLALHTATSLGAGWGVENLVGILWSRDEPSPLGQWPAWFLAGVVAVAWALWRRVEPDLLAWAVLAALVLLTAGRIGAAHNYLMEPTAVGLMLFGVFLATEAPRPGPAGKLALLLTLLLALQMGWTALHRPVATGIMRLPVDGAASARVVELLRGADGPVLVEDTGLALLAGREPALMPFEFTMLSRAGAIDPAPVFDQVAAGAYPLIVLRFDPTDPAVQARHRPGEYWELGRWPDGIIAGVQARYRLAERAGPYYIFRPRTAPAGEGTDG